jgi:GNAT superfamily N-acetyltransferase
MSAPAGEFPRFEPLDRTHDRAAFCCQHPEFASYLQHTALQQARRRICAVTVLLVDSPTRIAGYHTLSATALNLGELPTPLAHQYPGYREGVPATLIGRLAVDDGYRGKGWGETLLMNALARSLSATTTVASALVIVRAIDRQASQFYQHYGFEPFPSDPLRLFLPMRTVARLL